MDLRTTIIDAIRQRAERAALNAGGQSAGEAGRQADAANLDAQRRGAAPARDPARNPKGKPVDPAAVLPPGVLQGAAEAIRARNKLTAEQG